MFVRPRWSTIAIKCPLLQCPANLTAKLMLCAVLFVLGLVLILCYKLPLWISIYKVAPKIWRNDVLVFNENCAFTAPTWPVKVAPSRISLKYNVNKGFIHICMGADKSGLEGAMRLKFPIRLHITFLVLAKAGYCCYVRSVPKPFFNCEFEVTTKSLKVNGQAQNRWLAVYYCRSTDVQLRFCQYHVGCSGLS